VAISGSRDIGSEVPETVSGKMKRNLASAVTRRGGKKTVVAADVHCTGDGNVSTEHDVEPDPPDSDSSDGRTLWYLTSDIERGTRTTLAPDVGPFHKVNQIIVKMKKLRRWIRGQMRLYQSLMLRPS